MNDTDTVRTTNQYLTFTLGEEVYAFDVTHVREILEVIPITKVPRTPDFMRGVINNRGSVVPVIDLRLKFGMTKTEKTVNTCIIVTEVSLGSEPAIIGVLTDSVQEVIELESDQIEPPPRIGTGIRADFIQGIGKREDAFVLLLDITRIFSPEELAVVQSSGAETAG